MKKVLLIMALPIALLVGCSKSDNGELIGVQDRPFFEDMDLTGMVFINQGSFTMGAGAQNQTYGATSQPRTMQVGSYFMDETEITNNEYRQFVRWVVDSIARKSLGESYEEYLQTTDEWGEDLDDPIINRRNAPDIDWNSEDEDYRQILADALFLAKDNSLYGRKAIDIAKLNYEYYYIDFREAATKEDNTNVRDEHRGTIFTSRPKGLNNRKSLIKRELVNIYPDTLCWIHDYTYSMNEDFTRQYFSSPAYDNYPVVGISWVQAKAFCVWRSNYLNSYLQNLEYTQMNDFRLPTEAEWEYAARGGIAQQSYPWGGPYVRNPNGCFLANYEPLRGAYDDDGGVKTLMVGHYAPNDYGLYDMSGNVAEWCLDAYCESTYIIANALSPFYNYDAEDDDPLAMKRKVIRGGSWKDQKYFIQVQTRDYEFQDTSKSYIGFRCIQPYLGRVKGDNLRNSSNIMQ